MAAKLSLYAIGLGGWVEIRSSLTPPISKTSTSERMGMKKVIDKEGGFDTNWNPRMKMVPGKVTFTVTIWKGGKVEGVMKVKEFESLTGYHLECGRMLSISSLREGVESKLKTRLEAK